MLMQHAPGWMWSILNGFCPDASYAEWRAVPAGKRMLSPEVVEMCHIVSTETKVCMGRVGQSTFDAPSLIFPYFNEEGKLVSVQSRYLGEERRSQDSSLLQGVIAWCTDWSGSRSIRSRNLFLLPRDHLTVGRLLR